MNKFVYIIQLVVALLLVSVKGVSQGIDKAQLRVVPQEVEQRGDELYINMNIDISRLVIDSDRSLTLTPILRSSDKEKELPEVIINGTRRHKAYEREMSLLGNKRMAQIETPYNVLRAKSTPDGIFPYTLSIPFEEWMKDARLDLKEDLCGCAGSSQEVVVERLVNRVMLEFILPYDVNPVGAYIKPEVEAIKNRSEQVDVFLDFPVMKTTIIPDFGNNPRELSKIESMIREIHGDKNIQVSQADIIGYASPEGSVTLNNQLSQGRAQALRSYLAMRTEIPAGIYRVSSGGEDWKGLIKLVEESVWSDRDQILYVIQGTSSVEERKYKLKTLNGGQSYNRLLTEMYPQLRRVLCRVNYTVRGFSVEEGREIIKKRPQQLSLEEMFLVANTYPVGSDTFVEVFETAVRMFPDDKVANLNAAATALMQKDVVKAEKYLQLADKNTPEYINNLGLLHLLRDDYDVARKLLTEASGKGVAAAKQNLEELEKKLDTNSRIERR